VQNGSASLCPVCDGEGQVAQKFNRSPYDFVMPKTAITANIVRQAIAVKITTDYDIEWWDTVADYTSPLLQIIMELDSRSFMNTVTPGNTNGIDIVNWAGTAQLPYARRFPFVLTRGSQLVLYVTELSGSTNTLQVVFRGFQLMPQQRQAGQ
jgi:hypothetical protein